MKQLKKHCTSAEAFAWIEDNAEDLCFLHANRNLSVGIVAQNLSDEVQRGMIDRNDFPVKGIKEVLHFVNDLKNDFTSRIIQAIES